MKQPGLRQWQNRFRELFHPPQETVAGLRVLLERLLRLQNHSERLQWLEDWGHWLRLASQAPAAFLQRAEPKPAQKLRFFLAALGDYPAAREAFLENLRHALLQTSGLKLFADAGLPSEYGFLGESTERALRKILPRPPDESNLSELLERLFAQPDDAKWVASLSPELLMEAARLLFFEGDVEKNPWRHIRNDMRDALTVLAADIASLGVSSDILDRLPKTSLRDLPFLALSRACDELEGCLEEPENWPDAMKRQLAVEVTNAIRHCRDCVKRVVSHLETHGVSVHLVYRLEKISAILDRIEALVSTLVPQEGPLTVKQISQLLASLIEGIHNDRSVRSVFRVNLRQLSRKVVERTGESGEHYIVRSRADWLYMLKGAAGGGFLTLFTLLFKFGIAAKGLALFLEGVALAFNYAGSFLLMQWLGFKLATKQPSMFAAAIAGKLLEKRYLNKSEEFVEEVKSITRSQTAAVLGNIGLIIPSAVLFDCLWRLLKGNSYLSPEKAQSVVNSLHPFASGTIFYAALTGVILMVSSLVGSWLENFIVFRRVPEGIAHHRGLVRWVGHERATRLSKSVLHGVSGVGISVTLGLLLGLTPVFGTFLGLPLDVRHVTLSTGQLGLGLSALGWDSIFSTGALMAMLGIVFVGLLNFGVSFALALLLAMRAREVSAPASAQLLRDTLRAFSRRPLDFLIPPKGKGEEKGTEIQAASAHANGNTRTHPSLSDPQPEPEPLP
jgi:site-specific recombinase